MFFFSSDITGCETTRSNGSSFLIIWGMTILLFSIVVVQFASLPYQQCMWIPISLHLLFLDFLMVVILTGVSDSSLRFWIAFPWWLVMFSVFLCVWPSCDSAGKESACNAGDLGLIPELQRSPGEGKGYTLQYSDLENSMDYIVHGVRKSWTRLSDFHFTSHLIFLLWKNGYSDPHPILFNWVVFFICFLTLICINSLSILDINPFGDISFRKYLLPFSRLPFHFADGFSVQKF